MENARATGPLKVEKAPLSPKSNENTHKTSKGAKREDKHINKPKMHSPHTYAKLNVTTKNYGPKQVWIQRKLNPFVTVG